jgi:hypothetical protein
MNTLAGLKNWRIRVTPLLKYQAPDNLLVKIGMDCLRMVAVVAFSAMATLIIGV